MPKEFLKKTIRIVKYQILELMKSTTNEIFKLEHREKSCPMRLSRKCKG